MWGDLPLVPTMATGASDGKFTRIAGIPTYGIACMFFDMDDSRAHGKDERVNAQDFYEGLEFGYRLIRELASGKS
jgi:acetylornithine deacetylase/succinyl-diaminopimelate desuccinylase-like protein